MFVAVVMKPGQEMECYGPFRLEAEARAFIEQNGFSQSADILKLIAPW